MAETQQNTTELQKVIVPKIVDACFMNCVNSFPSSTLAAHEDLCVHKCIEKYIVTAAQITNDFNNVVAERVKLRRARATNKS